MRSIETKYKGYRFRSRTEARWAVFFDKMGFRWEYEPEGYADTSTAYLPDFLVTFTNGAQILCEAKPDIYDFGDDDKYTFYYRLSSHLNMMIVFVTGVPGYRAYDVIFPKSDINTLRLGFFQDYEPYLQLADKYWVCQMEMDEHDGHFRFPFDDRRARKAFGRLLVEAVVASRHTRFDATDQ